MNPSNSLPALSAGQIIFPAADVHKASAWLANRGGIAVWSNKDLGSSSLGHQKFTPANDENGQPTKAPHWNCGTSGPDFIVTEARNVFVETVAEVARVKVRNGPPYLGGINRADWPKLDKAMAAAGQDAFWWPDYSEAKYGSAWFVAVVCKVTGRAPAFIEGIPAINVPAGFRLMTDKEAPAAGDLWNWNGPAAVREDWRPLESNSPMAAGLPVETLRVRHGQPSLQFCTKTDGA